MTDLPPSQAKKIVFLGSGDFSVPALQALHQGPDELVLVVSNPPAPSGRGRKLTPSPVALYAAENGLDLFESRSVRSSSAIDRIKAAGPDLMVVAAFGGFLPEELLNMCPYPPLNIHPSLLPLHRGPAPINWALIKGDKEIGVSIIFLEKEMDAGPILCQRAFPVTGPRSAGQWEEELAVAGARDLMLVIEKIKTGRLESKAQNSALASVNPLLKKSDGKIDWSRPAPELCSLINGVDPWPGAQSLFQGKSIKIFGAWPSEGQDGTAAGKVLYLDNNGHLVVAAGAGTALSVAGFQPEGKKRMGASDFVRGYKPEMLGI